jgi:tetratricopeptide (TPR) repeat protein
VAGFLSAPAGSTSFRAALVIAQDAAAIPFPDYKDLPAGNAWTARISSAVEDAAKVAKTGDDFLALATLAAKGAGGPRVRSLSDEAIRRHTQLPDSARMLMMNTWDFDLIFSPDSMSKPELARALSLADTLVMHTPRNAKAYLFRARILSTSGRGPEAIASANRAVSLVADSSVAGFYWTTLHQIVALRGTGAEDDAVFSRMVQTRHVTSYDWAEHGGHLMKRERWSDAAHAYSEAFQSSSTDAAYACEAGRGYWGSSQADLALDAFRACLESFAHSATPDSTKMAYAHRGIATILNDRGVSAQAEGQAREARALEPGNAWTALELSRALLDQDRPTEAATAAEEAVRLSDGKFSSMQFAAGQAYFKLQDWTKCARAFEHAADLNPKDDTAPYNTALCLARQGFSRDAATWMETAIRRNPTSPDRANREALVRSWKAPLS